MSLTFEHFCVAYFVEVGVIYEFISNRGNFSCFTVYFVLQFEKYTWFWGTIQPVRYNFQELHRILIKSNILWLHLMNKRSSNGGTLYLIKVLFGKSGFYFCIALYCIASILILYAHQYRIHGNDNTPTKKVTCQFSLVTNLMPFLFSIFFLFSLNILQLLEHSWFVFMFVQCTLVCVFLSKNIRKRFEKNWKVKCKLRFKLEQSFLKPCATFEKDCLVNIIIVCLSCMHSSRWFTQC